MKPSQQKYLASSNPEILITLKDLNYFYGEKHLRRQVLFDINLQINAGEIVILSGPSGSGKTTLLTLIGGLRVLQTGSIQLLGAELFRARPQHLALMRRQIGFIFQAHNLHPSLTATENVMMGLEMHGVWTRTERREKAVALLKEIGLGERAHLRPHDLSGGQKQRVAIARAIISQPRIILADEPTASLDKQSGREAVELLQHLASASQASVLLITHDNRILDVADHLIYMEDGRLVKDAHGTILHRM